MPKISGTVKTKQLAAQGPNPKNTVAGLGPGVVLVKGGAGKKFEKPSTKNMPSYDVVSRRSPFVAMLSDPVNAQPALPPCSLPARAIPIKLYQEVLLTTDAAGNAGLNLNPLVNGLHQGVSTWTGGTTQATFGTLTAHSEYTNFATNFIHYVPLCMAVETRYTGSMTSVSGRFYGIVGQAGDTNVANFPREPNGCEAITSEGISCVWFSTEPVWSNPTVVATTAGPVEWMDTQTSIALIGGPVSVSNVVTVGIWLHLCAFPRNGIVGLTPQISIPDATASMAASLMMADEDGDYASSMALTKRKRRNKKTKTMIRDGLRIGGKLVGSFNPALGGVASAAEALAMLLD